MVEVDRLHRYPRHDRAAGRRREKHAQLVVVPIAGHLQQPRERRCGEPAQARLAVAHGQARRRAHRGAAQRVAHAAAPRDPRALEVPLPHDDVRSPGGQPVRDGAHARGPVLPVGVRGDDVAPGMAVAGVDERRPQGGAFAAVDVVPQHVRADPGRLVEHGVVRGAGAVVDDQHVGQPHLGEAA
ncbi:hypothetical protein JCM11754A_08090 [Isoptericola variabilis]